MAYDWVKRETDAQLEKRIEADREFVDRVPPFTRRDIGCCFEKELGWSDPGNDIHYMVRDMAREYGMVSKLDELWGSNETTDEAEAFLNNLTDDDVRWGSNEFGDWGLWYTCDIGVR